MISSEEPQGNETPLSKILLDNQSSIHIIGDASLLTNIRTAPVPMIITGIDKKAKLIATQVGEMKFIGTVYYHPDASGNVLCQTDIEDRFSSVS